MTTWSIHTMVLDLDDTLFAEAEFVLSGFGAAGEWLRTERGVDRFAETSAGLFEQGVRGNIFDEALRTLGVVPDGKLVRELVRAYREHRPRISMLADVARFFAKAPEVRFALLSDGFVAVQRRKFDALNLAPRFSSVVFTDSFGREAWKPSPVGFEHIMAQLGGSAAGFMYVADNPRKDFIAPRALGWRTVRVRRAAGEHVAYEASPAEAADVEIRSFDELPALFEPTAASPAA